MSAAGNDAQTRAKTAGVLERVVEGQLDILGTPQHQHGTPYGLELLPWVVHPERLPGAVDVGVQELRSEEAFDRLVRQSERVRDRHEAEDKPTQQTRTGNQAAIATRQAAR